MKKPSPALIILLVALLLLVLALVIVRTDGTDDENDSLAWRLSLGIIFAFLTVGPAFFAEMLMRALFPASLAARELAEKRKAFHTVDKTKRVAERQIHGIADEHALHDYWTTKIRGRYYTIFDQARAKFGHTEPPSVRTTQRHEQ